MQSSRWVTDADAPDVAAVVEVVVEDAVTVHIIKRPDGRIEVCREHPAYCAECADILARAIWAHERKKMATLGREAAWDADGREVAA